MRSRFPPKGAWGGADGRPARLTLDGETVDPKQGFVLHPGSDLMIGTAGGGYGSPGERAEST